MHKREDHSPVAGLVLSTSVGSYQPPALRCTAPCRLHAVTAEQTAASSLPTQLRSPPTVRSAGHQQNGLCSGQQAAGEPTQKLGLTASPPNKPALASANMEPPHACREPWAGGGQREQWRGAVGRAVLSRGGCWGGWSGGQGTGQSWWQQHWVLTGGRAVQGSAGRGPAHLDFPLSALSLPQFNPCAQPPLPHTSFLASPSKWTGCPGRPHCPGRPATPLWELHGALQPWAREEGQL